MNVRGIATNPAVKTRSNKKQAGRRRMARAVLTGSAAVAALVQTFAGNSAKANTEDDVVNGQTDLTVAATYSGGLPGTTSDVTFRTGSYSPAAFTLATSLSIGTLDDFSGTALTINQGASGTSTLTLNGGSNSVAPSTSDLLYVSAGGNLTLGGGTGTLNVALGTSSGNFDVGGLVTDTSATINSVTSGTGDGITVDGTGRLTLTGSNSFTGPVTLNSGLLVVSSIANGSSNSGLGDSTNAAANLVFGGGELLYSGGSASTNRNFTINNGLNATIGASTANTLTIDGSATSSTGGLIISNTPVGSNNVGAGTIALGGANSYTGNTTVNAGTLKLDFTQTGAPTSNILYNGVTAGTLVMGGVNGVPAVTAWDGNPGSALTVTGKASTSNSQAFAGTTLNAGYSAISIAPGATGGQVYLNLGTITNNPGALVNFQQNGTAITNVVNANGIHIGNSNDASAILGGWATYGAPGSTVYAAVDANGNVIPYTYTTTTTPTSGTITDYGTGTPTNVQLTGSAAAGNITLSGTTAGATNINTLTQSSTTPAVVSIGSSNTLRFGVNGGILVGVNTATAANTALTIGTSTTDGTITAGGNSLNTAGTLTLDDTSNDTSAQSLVINSKIADNGSGKVTVVMGDLRNGLSGSQGNSYIIINGANAYTGGTYLVGSRIQVTNGGAFGTGPVTVLPGAQAYLNTGNNFANAFNIGGVGDNEGAFYSAIRLGGGVMSGNITLLGDSAIGSNVGGTLAGNLSGTGNLNLFGYNTTITLGSTTGGVSSTDKITGDLAINGFAPGSPLLTGNGNGPTIKLGGTAVLPDALANSASTGNVIINGPNAAAGTGGNAATLDLGGFSAKTNGIISTGANVLSSIITNSGSSATLTIGDNNANAVFGGTITDSGASHTLGITKAGSGTQTLLGANSYIGATTVNGGTLALGAGGSLGASAVTVNAGGTFAVRTANGNTNSVGNATFTLNSGSQLNMADGYYSTLNLAGAATLAPASGVSPILSFDLTGANTDVLAIAGAATVGAAGANINIVPNATATAGTYSVITAASGLNTNFSLASSLLAAGNGLYTLSLASSTATAEQVTVAGDANALYWKGASSTAWNTAGNWTTDQGGTSVSSSAPTSSTDVAFSATGATNLTTDTLTAGLTVNSVTFLNGAASVTVGTTGNTANQLTINGGGINNASANAMTINNPITLGAAQTWTNNGAGLLTLGGAVTNSTSNLTVAGTGNTTISGAIGSGTGGLAMSGSGTLVLGNLTGNTYTGATTISAGTVRANNTTSGSATGTGNITAAAGMSNYGGGTLGGSGSVSGTVTLASSATQKQGGVIAAGASSTATGTLTTGSETWNGGAAYEWKLSNAGTNAAAGTGLSTSGAWDDVSMSALSLSSGGTSQPITIALDSLSSPTGSGKYSWIIAQTTASHVSGFSGAFTGTNYEGQNLLTNTLAGVTATGSAGGYAAFALDTSGFGDGGFSLSGGNSYNFSLEFVSNGGNGDNLVLDYNSAPEPGTMILVLAGSLPMLSTRRRRRKTTTAQ